MLNAFFVFVLSKTRRDLRQYRMGKVFAGLRVADLEAYITNTAPKALSSPGPGHNAWMMASSALVLFMTLPGLALFYGGLVRRKNVLSVMAQCLGCAGVVTILWWLVGYSFTFSNGSPFLGGLKFA